MSDEESRCPFCSEVSGEYVARRKDKKGVHKCAQCRRELLPSYAKKLPEIKEALRAGLKERGVRI